MTNEELLATITQLKAELVEADLEIADLKKKLFMVKSSYQDKLIAKIRTMLKDNYSESEIEKSLSTEYTHEEIQLAHWIISIQDHKEDDCWE